MIEYRVVTPDNLKGAKFAVFGDANRDAMARAIEEGRSALVFVQAGEDRRLIVEYVRGSEGRARVGLVGPS